MSVHIHTLRSYAAAAVGLVLAVLLFGWAYAPRSSEFELATVTGRVTCGTHPLGVAWVMFEETAPRGFTACAKVHADGSFRMQPWGNFGRDGVAPGTYHVFFVGDPPDVLKSSVDEKYQHPETSDLLVHVRPAWNEFAFSLPEPGRGPTLAQHR